MESVQVFVAVAGSVAVAVGHIEPGRIGLPGIEPSCSR